MNVYDAFLARMHFLFEEFDHIYVSFSGGKDSGLLLNLVLDYRNQHYPERAIGVFHQDFEAQYMAVSYTHLDVYKRQSQALKKYILIFQAELLKNTWKLYHQFLLR